MAARTFTDEELALIVRRAARLQADEGEQRYSLADVQNIATQVGIGAELVAQVAEELDSGERDPRGARLLLGAPACFVATGTMSRVVSQDEYAGLINAIRARTRVSGQITQVGTALEWRLGVGSTSDGMAVVIAPGKAGTRVRVETTLRSMRLTLHTAGVLGGVALAMITTGGAATLTTTGAALLLGLMGWGLARAWWTRVAKAADERAHRMRDLVLAQLQPVGGGEP